MKKKILALFLLLMCAITVFPAFTASASEPYQTYTYSIDGKALFSPAAYVPTPYVIDSDYMGLLDPKNGGLAFDEPADIYADEEGNIYLADSKNNRVIVLDEYYKLKFILSAFANEHGATYQLSNPQGVFVTKEKGTPGSADYVPAYIYVCDTGNSQIVRFYTDGSFDKIIPRPESNLFGNSAAYKPIAVAVDQYGRMFVVSSTTYQGVIVMTDDGVFTGFIGAQKVTYSLIDIIWRRFQTAEMQQGTVDYVSVEFNNISIDDDGFVYVTTDAIDANQQMEAIVSKSADFSPVKKLNSAGDEIMKRNGFFDPGGEVDVKAFAEEETEKTGPSQIRDVAIGPENTWSIIDAKRNKVFTYDQNGSLLFAFGDEGEMRGQMKSICGITYQGERMLLLDKATDSFTVYRRTEYGDRLINAIKQENDRNYTGAISAWQEVLKYNNNFDTAYIGVGKALFREGNYEEAMEYFRAAYDEENYSNAYREVRTAWISDPLHLLLIPLVVVVFCFGLSRLLRFASKVNAAVAIRPNRKTTYWEELLYSFYVPFHPFDGFWDLKHEKRGSVRASLTIIGLVVVCFYYQSVGTGYIMNPDMVYSTFLTQVISVAVPILLWVVANWCLTTLFEGEGSFKDIIIAVGYAVAPMIFFLIMGTLLSNIVAIEEAALVTLLITIGYIWSGCLLFFGLMVTHDYSMLKNLLITICTIVGMAVIIFVALLFSGLLTKMVSFVSSIITEISYRL